MINMALTLLNWMTNFLHQENPHPVIRAIMDYFQLWLVMTD
jgi:hypothetical protein